MDVNIKAMDELEVYDGEHRQPLADFAFAAKQLGVTAWGMNVITGRPGWQDYPDHDHTEDGQEEVYVVLQGSATLVAGDQSWELQVGHFARVGPAVSRKLIPGPDGMQILAIGGTPGQAYAPPPWAT